MFNYPKLGWEKYNVSLDVTSIELGNQSSMMTDLIRKIKKTSTVKKQYNINETCYFYEYASNH